MIWIANWYRGDFQSVTIAGVAQAVDRAVADNFASLLTAIAQISISDSGGNAFTYSGFQLRQSVPVTALDGGKWIKPEAVYSVPVVAIEYTAASAGSQEWDGQVFRLEQAQINGNKWVIAGEQELRPREINLINWGKPGNWRLGFRFSRGIRPGTFKIYQAVP